MCDERFLFALSASGLYSFARGLSCVAFGWQGFELRWYFLGVGGEAGVWHQGQPVAGSVLSLRSGLSLLYSRHLILARTRTLDIRSQLQNKHKLLHCMIQAARIKSGAGSTRSTCVGRHSGAAFALGGTVLYCVRTLRCAPGTVGRHEDSRGQDLRSASLSHAGGIGASRESTQLSDSAHLGDVPQLIGCGQRK